MCFFFFEEMPRKLRRKSFHFFFFWGGGGERSVSRQLETTHVFKKKKSQTRNFRLEQMEQNEMEEQVEQAGRATGKMRIKRYYFEFFGNGWKVNQKLFETWRRGKHVCSLHFYVFFSFQVLNVLNGS